MRKFLFWCCAVLCLVGMTACGPKNPNELIYVQGVEYVGTLGDKACAVYLTYRTTSEKEYDFDIYLFNLKGEEITRKKIPFVGWEEANIKKGIRDVPITIYINDDQPKEGHVRIVIKDGDKVIKDQTFAYKCEFIPGYWKK